MVDLHTGLRYFVIGFYSVLVLLLVLETRQSVRVLERNENFAAEQVILEQFQESYTLKKQLLTKHLWLGVFYCTCIVCCLVFVQFSPRNLLYAAELIVGSLEYE